MSVGKVFNNVVFFGGRGEIKKDFVKKRCRGVKFAKKDSQRRTFYSRYVLEELHTYIDSKTTGLIIG